MTWSKGHWPLFDWKFWVSKSLGRLLVETIQENSPSGLWRQLGKLVGCKPSWVRIPYSPRLIEEGITRLLANETVKKPQRNLGLLFSRWDSLTPKVAISARKSLSEIDSNSKVRTWSCELCNISSLTKMTILGSTFRCVRSSSGRLRNRLT